MSNFNLIWRPGRQVQEVAAPHRKGVIRLVIGTGGNALIFVNLYSHPAQSFSPAQLTPL